jgi:hypothetical protein
MKPLTKDQIVRMDKMDIIKYYRSEWDNAECIYFLQVNLGTMNPKPIYLLNKCNEILL